MAPADPTERVLPADATLSVDATDSADFWDSGSQEMVGTATMAQLPPLGLSYRPGPTGTES
jgi:hypothetical protein